MASPHVSLCIIPPAAPPRRPRHTLCFATPACLSYRSISLRRSHARYVCSVSEPQMDQKTEQFRDKLLDVRQRSNVLNARVIVRVAEAGIRLGSTLLDSTTSQEETVLEEQQRRTQREREREREAERQTLKRLKKDLKNVNKMAYENEAVPETLDVIRRLQYVVDALDTALQEHQRRAQHQASDVETLDDILLDAPPMVDDDFSWNNDADPAAQDDSQGRKGIVTNVRESVLERGNELKRKASQVGAGIEENVARYVRDDGTVDFNSLRVYVAQTLDNLGMTWKRLNGRVPKEPSSDESKPVTVLAPALEVRDADKEFALREEIGKLEAELINSSKKRESVLRNEDQLGKLIRAKEIRLMDDSVCALRRTLAVRVLQLEMEKIFVSLAEEIENSEYELMMDQRVLVAEFSDLDERLATLDLFIDEDEPLLIDDDVVGELAADIQDLKSRLGIDDPLYSSSTLSVAQARQFFRSSVRKTRDGAEFYSRGLRLFSGDLRFAFRLIRRSLTGYAPSPREIRTIRRTGKDLLTLIPFTIVLIAPLTPIGHVLIFGFLQRYWPEFFPSTFSERRQAVMKRHEQYQLMLQTEAGEQSNGVSEGVAVEENETDGLGPFEFLKRSLSFMFVTNETNVEDVTKVEDGEDGGKSDGEKSTKEVKSEGNGVADEDVEEEEQHPVVLNELAESVREKQARKKRFGPALDELHLAD